MTNTEEPSVNSLKPVIPVSAEDHVQRDTIFHYSRERRLSRASPEVQALNEGKTVKAGLFRALFANGSHRMILFVIVFAFAAFGLASRFGDGGEGHVRYQCVILGGNLLALTIQPVEETLFLTIIKYTPESGEFYTGAVDISVSPVMSRAAEGEEREVPAVFTHRIFFNLVESEFFQLSLPFDETDFFVVLRAGEEQRTLRLQASGS